MARHLSLSLVTWLLLAACSDDRLLVGNSRIDGAAGNAPGNGGTAGAMGGATSSGGTTADGAGGQAGSPGLDAAGADVPSPGGMPGMGGRGSGGTFGFGGGTIAGSLGSGGSETGGGSGGNGRDAGQDIAPDINPLHMEARRDVFAEGPSVLPLQCNGKLLLGGLPVVQVGTYPFTAATGDLDGDGKLDLVTLSSRDGLSVLFGQGDGSLVLGHTYDLEEDLWEQVPSSLALGDLNRDGKLDIVFANTSVKVLLATAYGTYPDIASYPAGDSPQSLALGDLDGDGYLDIVVANMGADTVSVLRGKGDGSFAAKVDYPAGDSPDVVLIGDVNKDGKPDLVVADARNCLGNVLLGKGDGTFGAKKQFGAPTAGYGSDPYTAALGDVNGDGNLDLVMAAGLSRADVVLGNGDGTFGRMIRIDDRPGDYHVMSLQDLDGDHTPELVLKVGGVVQVLSANAYGTFSLESEYSTGTGEDVAFAALGDFDGDGMADLATTFRSQYTGWVSVRRGTGSRAFFTAAEYPMGNEVSAIALADLTRDGIADIATASSGNTVTALVGKGDGTFVLKDDLYTPMAGRALAVGDLDGDGKPDIATLDGDNGVVGVLLGKGDGTFATKGGYATATQPKGLALGDLDGDGRLDAVTANFDTTGPGTGSISVLLGKGDGSFGSHVEYATGPLSIAVSLGDLNGDGKLDAVVGNYAGDFENASVSVLLGNGNGTFQPQVKHSLLTALLVSLLLGDLNGDGKLDIAWGDSSNYVGVMLGKGDGTFGESVSYPVQYGSDALAAGDVNLDGSPDLVAMGLSVGLLLGKGDGSFADAIYYPAASTSAALADLDRDGRLELVATHAQTVFLLDLCR